MSVRQARRSPETVEKLSPVDYAIISQALMSSAREMGVNLCRSAYSTIVREAKDASTGLLDASGASVAQSDELIPILVGSLSHTFRHCAAQTPPDELKEGDFYITNHPYLGGGQHLQDIFVFMPIFFEGELVGFSAAVAHHLDIGGGAPGIATAATDFYQEGLILPPARYNLARDWNGGPFERLMTANVRVPDQTIGDMNSQFAACGTGIARVQELCARHGVAKLRAAMREMQEYAERRVRAVIQSIPDGVYVGEDAVDDDGLSDTPLRIRATVTVKGDAISVDYSGTCDQVETNLNAPFASTIGSTLSALKSALTTDDVPYNEGVFRAVTISAPLGSLLNPRSPAPVRARMESIYRAFDCVVKALGQAVPERIAACGFDTTVATCLSKLDQGRYRVYLEIHNGGWGGSPQYDGCDAVAGPLSNCTNVPIEALDMDFDFFRVEGYGLLADTGGKGRHRGGLGFYRSYRVLKDGVKFAIYADRFRIPPSGLAGGEDGTTGSCEIHRGDERIPVRSKDSVKLQKGDLLVLKTGGGGGYGQAAERSDAAIARDLNAGFVTA
jgi:N-methylhydantoinase B